MRAIAERINELATQDRDSCNSEPQTSKPSKAMLVVDPDVLSASTLKALIRLGAMFVTLPSHKG